MWKKLLITVVGLFAVVAGIATIFGFMVKAMMNAPQSMPAAAVTTVELKREAWHPTLTSVGSLSAVQGVTVSAQLDGTVTALHFQSGTRVKAGELLIEEDVGPEKAQLAAVEASLQLAKVNLKRSAELLKSNTIAQSQYDTDFATEKQYEAQAENIRATIDKKTIRAPFAGRLGVRLVDLGQTLKAGDAIVSLQTLDPIFVDFYLPQQQLSQVQLGLTISLKCDAYPGREFSGKLTAINPEVDPATRNLRVQATIANAKEELRPGMFVKVDVVLPQVDQVLPIPQTAVLYAPYGDSVYIVVEQKDPKTGVSAKVVKQTFVRLGRRRGDFVVVDKGLKEGDVVVSSGVFKLFPGMAVTPNNALAPDAQLAPEPSDS